MSRTSKFFIFAPVAIALSALVAGCSGTGNNPDACGDGAIDDGEVCDGENLSGASCESLGFPGGALACESSCQDFDTSTCDAPASCGNGVLDGPEQCDGAELAGQSCASLGLGEGQLVCDANCGGYDISGCGVGEFCGDGAVNGGDEVCDGSDLDGFSCGQLGFIGGQLACGSNCTEFDTAGCISAGSQFAGAHAEWPVPTGDALSEQVGFAEANYRWGFDVYNTFDIDGDGRPDLVWQTDAAAVGGDRQSWGYPGDPHWRVFTNDGSGFATAFTEWPIPGGDELTEQAGFAEANYRWGFDVYNTFDIDGDGRPDLVWQTDATAVGGDRQSWGYPGNPHWRVFLNTGTGFATTYTEWSLPAGDELSEQSGFAEANYRWGFDVYNTFDINGDGRPDLVWPTDATATGGDRQSWGYPGNPHWRVFLNTGAGFATTYTEWPVPSGDGLTEQSGFAETNHRFGYDVYNTFDIDGDARPDLVWQTDATAVGGDRQSWGYPGDPHWRVFLNTGTGFAATFTEWPVPVGDELAEQSGFAEAHYRFGYDVYNTFDIDGDSRPDLVWQTDATVVGGDRQSWGYPVNSHWRVFLNTGTGFATTSTEWPIPAGEELAEQSGFAEANYRFGYDVYNAFDIDGDSRPDLVWQTDATAVGGDRQSWGAPGDTHWRVFFNE